jgi:hypothetical protein
VPVGFTRRPIEDKDRSTQVCTTERIVASVLAHEMSRRQYHIDGRDTRKEQGEICTDPTSGSGVKRRRPRWRGYRPCGEVPPVQQGYTEEIQDEMHNMFTRVNPTVLRRSVRGARKSSRLSQQARISRSLKKPPTSEQIARKADRVEKKACALKRV